MTTYIPDIKRKLSPHCAGSLKIIKALICDSPIDVQIANNLRDNSRHKTVRLGDIAGCVSQAVR